MIRLHESFYHYIGPSKIWSYVICTYPHQLPWFHSIFSPWVVQLFEVCFRTPMIWHNFIRKIALELGYRTFEANFDLRFVKECDFEIFHATVYYFTGYMAGDTILLEPYLLGINILQLWSQKFPYHVPVTFDIHNHIIPMIILKEEWSNNPSSQKSTPYSYLLRMHLVLLRDPCIKTHAVAGHQAHHYMPT